MPATLIDVRLYVKILPPYPTGYILLISSSTSGTRIVFRKYLDTLDSLGLKFLPLFVAPSNVSVMVAATQTQAITDSQKKTG